MTHDSSGASAPSPWATLASAADAAEHTEFRKTALSIIDKLVETRTFLQSDGTDDILLIKYAFMLACFTAFNTRHASITDMDLKAVLQRDFDDAFLAVRDTLKKMEMIP